MEENKKKCLLILPRPVFPLVCGYAHKNYNLIKILSQRYQQYVVVLTDRELLTEEMEFYKENNVNITVLHLSKYKSYFNTAINMFSKRPLQISYYYEHSFQKKIDLLIDQCDIIISALARTREYINQYKLKNEEHLKKKTVVFDMVDSIALNYKRSLSNTTSKFWKAIYKIEADRLMKYEKSSVENSDVTYLFNTEEKDFWKKYGNVVWLPHGVKEELFTYSKTDEKYKNYVAFIGKMDYQPNVDAALWYLKEVHSKLAEKIGFVIVGAYPSKEILEAAKKYKNVIVTGFVDDPYVYLNSAMAIAAPMQTGGGIQNKVLEGMALGKINIVSGLAAKPIVGAEDKKHLLIADAPDEYVKFINDIYLNSDQYAYIKENARELIKDTFSWKAYGKKYINCIENVMN